PQARLRPALRPESRLLARPAPDRLHGPAHGRGPVRGGGPAVPPAQPRGRQGRGRGPPVRARILIHETSGGVPCPGRATLLPRRAADGHGRAGTAPSRSTDTVPELPHEAATEWECRRAKGSVPDPPRAFPPRQGRPDSHLSHAALPGPPGRGVPRLPGGRAAGG